MPVINANYRIDLDYGRKLGRYRHLSPYFLVDPAGLVAVNGTEDGDDWHNSRRVNWVRMDSSKIRNHR